MAKILVTGASGFIGSHLVPKIGLNHHVYSLKSDLLNYQAVQDELLNYKPDIVVHLAARTEVELSFYEQTSFSEVNYVGSVNLIEAASKVPNLKNFIFASTMEVYGWQPISDQVKDGQLPQKYEAFDENTNPNPNAPYAVAKLAVEKYLQYMHRSRSFPFCAIRQTNSYGRRDNDFFVTEQIVTQMLKNKNEINLGYQYPWRNFLYIDDLIKIWHDLIEYSDKINDGTIFTVGPDRPIRIDAWAQLIANKIGWQGKINWDTKPKRPGEIYWLNSNNTLVQQKIGWYPKVDYDDGIDKTIEIWKKNIAIKNSR